MKSNPLNLIVESLVLNEAEKTRNCPNCGEATTVNDDGTCKCSSCGHEWTARNTNKKGLGKGLQDMTNPKDSKGIDKVISNK